MSENNRNIDELFRQELGNATEAPPSSVWEILEQRLDQASPPKKGYWNPYRLFVLFLIVAALIAAYFIWHNRATKDSEPIHNETAAAFSPGTTNPVPASPERTGRYKDTSQTLQATGTATKGSQHGQASSTATAHQEKQSVQREETADQNGANEPASGRQNKWHGKQDEEQTGRELQRSAARQKSAKQVTGRNTSRHASTESSTGIQQPIAPMKRTVQGRAEADKSGGTKPAPNSTAVTPKKTGRQTPGRAANSAGVAGVSKELLSSSAHGARTQNTGKGQSATSTTATGQNSSLEKAVNKEQTATAAITSTMVPAKATLAAKNSKEALATNSKGKPFTTLGKTVKPQLTAATAEQTKTTSNGSKEALATGSTSKSAATPKKTMQPEKTAATAGQAKTASNSRTETLAANNTGKPTATPEKTVQPEKTTAGEAKTASNSSKEAFAAGSAGKPATTPEKTVQPEKTTAGQAKTASNSSKETPSVSRASKPAATPEKTVQPEKTTAGQAKTASNSSKETPSVSSTGKPVTTPEKTVQPEKTASTAGQAKTTSNSSKETPSVSSTSKPATTQEQNKTPENTATAKQAKTLPATKREKDATVPNSVSAAGTAQNKAPEKTADKSKAGVQSPVPGATAQMTARQAKAEREPARWIQEDLKEKKSLTAKNEISQNEDSEDQASASGESTGGKSGGNASPPAKEKTRRPLNMSAGVKAAYEKGFQSYTANTVVASVYGEVNFSPKVSFIIQPGIKLANTSREYRTANGTYIRAGNVQSTMYYAERDSMNFPTGYKNYAYSQTYDSIVAYRQAQKKFTEFELPFLVRYKMDKNLSFLAGMNFTFGKTLKMEGILQTYGNLPLADSIFHHYDTAGITPPAPAVFTHSGSVPFSAYKDPGATTLINMIRFGYTIGLSYTVRQRMIIDLTLQQNLSRLSDIDDEQIKKLFTQPYVRLSLGYSILGRRK